MTGTPLDVLFVQKAVEAIALLRLKLLEEVQVNVIRCTWC
jgi:hypothetical protein